MIELEGISKAYGTGESRRQVLKEVSLKIDDGENVIILGASGSGKSTMLHIMGGLERADSGKIMCCDRDITMLNEKELTLFRKECVGFVFQQYYLLPDMTVDKNVRLGADLAQNKEYREIIEAVGLGDKLNKYPSQLSGGEQQRVAIARALAKKPKAVFMDEPTGALDEQTGRQILDYILKLKAQQNFTLVTVTHNSNIAETADRVIRLGSGVILEDYTNKNVKTAYEIGW